MVLGDLQCCLPMLASVLHVDVVQCVALHVVLVWWPICIHRLRLCDRGDHVVVAVCGYMPDTSTPVLVRRRGICILLGFFCVRVDTWPCVLGIRDSPSTLLHLQVVVEPVPDMPVLRFHRRQPSSTATPGYCNTPLARLFFFSTLTTPVTTRSANFHGQTCRPLMPPGAPHVSSWAPGGQSQRKFVKGRASSSSLHTATDGFLTGSPRVRFNLSLH